MAAAIYSRFRLSAHGETSVTWVILNHLIYIQCGMVAGQTVSFGLSVHGTISVTRVICKSVTVNEGWLATIL
jgi:hypothetical protein